MNSDSRFKLPSTAFRVDFDMEKLQRSKDDERSNGRSSTRYESSRSDILSAFQSSPERSLHCTHIRRKPQLRGLGEVVETTGIGGYQCLVRATEIFW